MAKIKMVYKPLSKEEKEKFDKSSQEFYEEHKAAGHIKDSTGSWIDPKNYIDTYYMDW